MKKDHHITVKERTDYHSKPGTPILVISGKYLKDAGFPAGTPVTVKIFNGTILICKE